jgi:hypothetical protein
MPADHPKFYLELLESRLRFLNAQLAKIDRWDPTFETLSAERDAVVLELEGLLDDVSRKAKR